MTSDMAGDDSLSPAEAAKRAGVSRGTIMNALKSKALYGWRDNQNRWKIAPDDLAKWMADRGSPAPDNGTDNSMTALHLENAELRGEIKALSVKLDAVQETLKRSEADLLREREGRAQDKADAAKREAWARGQIEALSRRRWWPW